ncbi:unnamed protein product [Colias eurytheme]|nr:unnamed protein product [Colias eurytheme]
MFRIIILFLNVFIVFGDDPIVETSHGIVQGKVLTTLYEEKEYYGFMGIPFAEPPVKELRFKAPREIDPWDGTLLATKEKPACIQFNNDVKKGQPLGQYGVEDCLYLDIFTPNIDENRRAVIVFIYNDRLQNSYNKSLDYAPDFFIEEDIVIVTPSHRLSTFGFLSFDDEHLPGNAGLLDLYLSLKWIAKNIQRFGGDPDRITLMGSQGGAAAIDLLLHSKANELFHSAILQSGTSLTTMYLQDNVRERALKLRELLNIPSTNTEKILKDLQDTLPSIIFRNELQAMPDNYNTDKQRSLLPFGPIVEKRPDGFITEYPENIVGSMKKPVMVGMNSREGLALSIHYLSQPNFFGSINKHFPLIMPKRLKYKLNPILDNYIEAIEEVKKFYFGKNKITIKNIPEFINYIGDVITAYSINMMVENFANKSSVYYYYFDYYSNLNQNKNNLLKLSEVSDGTWGTATGDELCYLFKCPELRETYLKYKRTLSQEFQIQRKMVKMWANFAKHSNPTPDENNPFNIKWPTYESESKQYLHIKENIEIGEKLLEERFKFWDDFMKKWEERAINEMARGNIKDEL